MLTCAGGCLDEALSEDIFEAVVEGEIPRPSSHRDEKLWVTQIPDVFHELQQLDLGGALLNSHILAIEERNKMELKSMLYTPDKHEEQISMNFQADSLQTMPIS